jgi:hypothetical protein
LSCGHPSYLRVSDIEVLIIAYMRLKYFKQCGYDVCDVTGKVGRPGRANVRIFPKYIHPDDRPVVYLLAVAMKLRLRECPDESL